MINSATDYKYSILLGDSGMGKTSLLLNYYARHCRSKDKTFNISLVPLNYKDADSVIKNTLDRSNTVLFLDAFDEDTKAIDNHRQRLTELLRLTDDFAQVLISCRTQFFEKDLEIPRETGIVRFGVTSPGQTRDYYFSRERQSFGNPFSGAITGK